MTCGGDFCTLWKPRPASPVDCRQTPAGRRLSKALSKIWAGCPSGGPFLVPPRKGERMRLKEALKGLLPQTNPSSLRILPARISFRKAGFRRFLRKHPRIQHIPCQCAHWRGIEDHFGFWNDCRWQSPFVDFSAFSRNAPWRSPTQWVCQITQFHSAQIGAFSAPGVP